MAKNLKSLVVKMHNATVEYLKVWGDIFDDSNEAKHWRKESLKELDQVVNEYADARRVLAQKKVKP